jgi:hypothetical protein
MWDGKSERNLIDKPVLHTPRNINAAYGSPEWEQDNANEIAERPQIVPLDKRAYPYGKPDPRK